MNKFGIGMEFDWYEEPIYDENGHIKLAHELIEKHRKRLEKI